MVDAVNNGPESTDSCYGTSGDERSVISICPQMFYV